MSDDAGALLTIATGATWPLTRRADAFGDVEDVTCPKCGRGIHGDLHMFWTCSRWETVDNAHIRDTQEYRASAIQGVQDGDRCYWLRGLVPKSWTRPAMPPWEWEVALGTGTYLVGEQLRIYTDGSGGRHTSAWLHRAIP